VIVKEDVVAKNLRSFLGFALLVGLLGCGAAATLSAQALAGQPKEKEKEYVAANSNGNVSAAKDAAVSAGATAAPVMSTPQSNAYRLGPEDELTVSVWHEPELSGGVTVRPGGIGSRRRVGARRRHRSRRRAIRVRDPWPSRPAA
jgi:hypothetical protein